jgi:regulator of nucleoside diphosphate kinase
MLALDVRSPRERDEAHALKAELKRAEIVSAAEIPPDAITMNTRAELLDLDTGERMEFTVVFPGDADVERGRISVLAPIGTGMLGYRVGDVFNQNAPTGVRRLKVVRVYFQPEAALAAAAA